MKRTDVPARVHIESRKHSENLGTASIPQGKFEVSSRPATVVDQRCSITSDQLLILLDCSYGADLVAIQSEL